MGGTHVFFKLKYFVSFEFIENADQVSSTVYPNSSYTKAAATI